MSQVEDLKILNDCRENRKIVQKLPDWLTHRWARIVSNQRAYPDFSQFVDFMVMEANIACNPITSFRTGKTTHSTEYQKSGKKHSVKEVTTKILSQPTDIPLQVLRKIPLEEPKIKSTPTPPEKMEA